MISEKYKEVLKIAAIPIAILVIVLTLYKMYSTIIKWQTSEPNYMRKPVNAKKPLQISADAVKLPAAGNEYSMMFWIYINDWSYRKGQWKHVLHKGDPYANRPQPGVWLAPNKNDLVIRYNTLENSGNYISHKRKMFRSFLNSRTVKSAYTVLGTDGVMPTYKQIKLKANNMGQKDIVVVLRSGDILNDSTVPIWAGIKHTDLTKDRVISQTVRMSDFTNKDIYACKFVGGVSLNPMSSEPLENDDGISNTIKNVPLNRWTHIAIVVSEHSTNVYVDGYLNSSNALKTHVKNNTGDLFVTNFGGFGGMLTHLKYFDTAISSQRILGIAQRGPDPWEFPDLAKLAQKYKPKFDLNKITDEDGWIL